MSETRTKARGLIDPSDVLDRQPGAREVLTVDGDWVPVSRVAYPEIKVEVEAKPRISPESLGTVAVSGLEVQPQSAGHYELGGPHPEVVTFGSGVFEGCRPFVLPIPPAPNAPEVY